MTPELKARIDETHGKIGGWCPIEKSYAMADLVIATQPRLIVEIGVLEGLSLFPQLHALAAAGLDGRVVGIDPWRHDNAIEGGAGAENAQDLFWSQESLHGRHTAFMENLWRRGLADRCVIMRCPSAVAACLFRPGAIDILHIDGNHSAVQACLDATLFVPLVRPGGHIWFDDADWPSVQEALSWTAARCEKLAGVQTCALFRKL